MLAWPTMEDFSANHTVIWYLVLVLILMSLSLRPWVSGKCNSLAACITNASSTVIEVYEGKKSIQKRAWTTILSGTVKFHYYTGMSEREMSTYKKLPTLTTMYNAHVDAHKNRAYILGNDRRDKSCSTFHHVTFSHAAVSSHKTILSVSAEKFKNSQSSAPPWLNLLYNIYYHIFTSIIKKERKKDGTAHNWASWLIAINI